MILTTGAGALGVFLDGASATRIGPGLWPRRHSKSQLDFLRVSPSWTLRPRGPGILEFAIDYPDNLPYGASGFYYPLEGDGSLQPGGPEAVMYHPQSPGSSHRKRES